MQEKQQTKQMALVIAVIVVAAAVIFGGGAFLFTQLFSGHIKPPSEYATVSLKADTYTATVTCEGTVKAAKTVSVSPEVDGTVKSVKVEDGDEVKKGDVLFTLKNPAIVNAAETAQANYDKAAEAQEKAQASYDAAADSVTQAKQRKKAALKAAKKAALKEAKAALAAQQAAAASDAEAEDTTADDTAQEADTSVDELTLDDMDVSVDASYDSAIETAKATAESAKASLEAAKSNTQNAKEASESAAERAALLKVRASMSGTVLNLKVEAGMSTAVLNAQGAALQISDLSTLLAMVDVPEESASRVVEGQQATVTSAALPADADISATVSKVADTPNETEGQDANAPLYYKATLVLGSGSAAKVGMKVSAQIELQDFGTVYYIPEAAVREQEGASFVEVVYSDDTSAQRQVIVVGHTEDGQAVIDAGTLVPNTTIRADLDE